MIRPLAVVAALVLVSAPAAAVDLSLPNGARELSSRISELDSYRLPVGPFADGAVPTRLFEGRVERDTYRIDGAATTTLQLLVPLRAQLEAAGYKLVYECEDRVCGGFDFRFQTEVLPAPNMHVDIRNYRFVAAVRGDAEALGLLVSRSRNAAYIQIIQTRPVDMAELSTRPNGNAAQIVKPDMPGGLADSLVKLGHVVLIDLTFETGADRLGAGPYASLQQLAAYLADHPDSRIALVGHTDDVGGLDANIDLSRRRAASVRARMIETYGTDPARLDAQGVGYLAPVASNTTRSGRDENRRVEAVLLTQ